MISNREKEMAMDANKRIKVKTFTTELRIFKTIKELKALD